MGSSPILPVIADWCNGSTLDSDSRNFGPIPKSAVYVPFASGRRVVCKTIEIGPTPIRYSIFPRRTTVVQIPVKDKVVGSSPTVGDLYRCSLTE